MTPLQSRSLILVAVLSLALLWGGCTNDRDFANPFDPENLRTAGSPPGLELAAGDEQVTVSWQDYDFGGIIKYRIYRRFTGNSGAAFELVGEVDAPKTEFVDGGLSNDAFDFDRGRQLYYVYRISYVDKNGVETPDPNAPPDDNKSPLRIWPTARVTPSISPPAPNVLIGDQLEDLTVKLFWQDYQFPEDFETFRVLATTASLSGDLPRFKLLGEITFNELTDSQRFGNEPIFFFDASFDHDGVTKVYRVIAVDRFGVEAETRINGTSPQLPPAPPQNVRATSIPRFGAPRIDVRISWTPNSERDLAGYQIYATTKVGGQLVEGDDLVRRGTARPKETSVTYAGEPLLLADQQLLPRRYFITAFDDTPRPDGSLDESVRVEVPLR
jgi:hypothetical protein